jgi:pimeloyl-ACP methyl ester carboxylesterase
LFTLARWLGPWADASRAPEVSREDGLIGATRARVYGDGPQTFLIAPGLHYAGPDDPRLDRFCRILAAAGHRVVAPFIAEYLALEPGPGAIAELAAVAAAFDEPPVVFSISFGSLLAFALAAERPAAVERLVVFGGYADFAATMRFCLTGEHRDPLNQPVVMMNLLDHISAPPRVAARAGEAGTFDHLAHDPDHRGALVAAWRRYVEATWGRPEMKARDRFVAVAEQLAPDVPEPVRELFLIGIGARPGAWQLAEPALARFCEAGSRALDPSPYLPRVRCRVDLVHGADDDVIPFQQSQELAARLVAADVRLHITGMYGHTGASAARIRAIPKELSTMLRVLRALA